VQVLSDPSSTVGAHACAAHAALSKGAARYLRFKYMARDGSASPSTIHLTSGLGGLFRAAFHRARAAIDDRGSALFTTRLLAPVVDFARVDEGAAGFRRGDARSDDAFLKTDE